MFIIYNYTMSSQQLTQRQRLANDDDEIETEFTLAHFKWLEKKNISVIHENQEYMAARINAEFRNTQVIATMVIAQTQSGKTGTMGATIKQMLTDRSNNINVENVYIITGLSSNEWKEQTRRRFPFNIAERVYDRTELKHIDLSDKYNVLIIMDEVHVACKAEQSIDKAFMKIGLYDKQFLYQHDIKIVEFSATPDGTLSDIMNWGNASRMLIGRPGDGYTGIQDLLKQGRVFQFKDLQTTDTSGLEELKGIIMNRYSEPKYHIIRASTGVKYRTLMTNLRVVFNNPRIEQYSGNNKKIKDINSILNVKPDEHTFIIIKEHLRCAKTITKKYIGVLYDRISNRINDSVIIQGLAGRATGYDDNGVSIVFTNIDTIERYQKLWNSRFEASVKWNSNTTNRRKCITTFNGCSNLCNKQPEKSIEAEYRMFDTFEEVFEFFEQHLKCGNMKGPRKRKMDANGFYPARLRGYPSDKIFTCVEILKNKNTGLDNTNYRVMPCYTDVTDPITLKWIITFYPRE